MVPEPEASPLDDLLGETALALLEEVGYEVTVRQEADLLALEAHDRRSGACYRATCQPADILLGACELEGLVTAGGRR